MKELEQLILSKSRPVQKEAKHIGVSELDKLIMEALLAEEREFSEYSPAEQKLINDFLAKLRAAGMEKAVFMPEKSKPKTFVFTNTAKDIQRDEFISKNFPDAKGKKELFLSSAGLKTGVKKQNGYSYLLTQGTGTGEDFSSTDYEGNLIDAFANVMNSRGNAGKKKNIAPKFDKTATTNVQAIEASVEKVVGQLKEIKFAQDTPLTKLYTDRGVKKETPKADIIFNGDIGVSVKKLEASQIMSAQGPEAAAVIAVAGEGKATEAALNIIQSIMRPERFSDEVIGVAGETSELPGSYKTDDKAGIKALNPILKGEDDTVTEPAKQTIKNNLAEEVKERLGEKLDDTLDNILAITKAPGFEKRVIFEAITGDKKFQTATPPGNATYMLKWSILDPAASQFKLVDEQTVNELLPQLKLDLRLRGKKRGGGWRLDQALSRAKDLLTEGEVLLTESQLTIINESANVIVEGFFADAWEKAKEVGGKVVNAVGNFIKEMKDYVVDLLKKIWEVIQKIAKQGFDYLLQFLGISFEEETGTAIVI